MGCSNSTRGLRAGGDAPADSDVIDYITMATLGNATNFGDLSTAVSSAEGSVSSSTRGVFAGVAQPVSNVIEYVAIATEGNTVDFGDLTAERSHGNGVSNAHGGLG